MKSHPMRGLMAAFLAIPLLLIASCSKDDSGTNPDNSGAPTLTFPQFNQAVTFVGSDAAMQGAKDKVQSEIARVAPWIATPKAIATALNAGQWGDKADGCWSKTSAQSNCTTTLKLCDSTGGRYSWTRTLNGNCSGVDRSNWVNADGSRNADGGSGVIRTYKSNSTDVDSVWSWTTSAGQDSKNWNIYAGTESPANLVAKLQWTKAAGNSSNWTFQQLGSFSLAAGISASTPAKWTMTVSSDYKTGTMDIYSWSTSAAAGTQEFWIQHHIGWNPDSSGEWIEYNRTGTVVNERNWPHSGPDIEIPIFGHDVVFDTTTECAKMAYIMAQAGLTSVQSWASVGREYMHYLDSLESAPVNGCWTWSGTYEGCTAEFSLCEEGSSYRWSWKLDGTCGGVTHSDWVGFEGTVSNDGKTGTVKIYNQGTTEVVFQTSWQVAADGSTDATFEMPNAQKWVTHESADGTSGSSRYYMWHDVPTPEYWLYQEIIWNVDGSGSSTTYMDNGTVMDECTWL